MPSAKLGKLMSPAQVNYGQVKHQRISSFAGTIPPRLPLELPRPSASNHSWKIQQDGVRLWLVFFGQLPLLRVVESLPQNRSPFVLRTASVNRPPERGRNLVIDLSSYVWYNGYSMIQVMWPPFSAAQ